MINRINARFLVVNQINEDTFLTLDILDGRKYILRRLEANEHFGRSHLKSIWSNSLRAVSKFIMPFSSAGCIVSIDGVSVSGEGYFLTEPYLALEHNLEDITLSTKQIASVLEKVAFEISALAQQKCTHGNLVPASISITNDYLPVIRNLRAVEFLRGNPPPQNEMTSLIQSLANKKSLTNLPEVSVLCKNINRQNIENNLTRKENPSTWLMGLDQIADNVSYQIGKSISLGCGCINVYGLWDAGFAGVAEEVAVQREIAGSITLLLDSEKLAEVNNTLKRNMLEPLHEGESPILSFIESHSYLPIEVVYLRRSDKADDLLNELYQRSKNEITLTCFSEQKTEFLPDHIVNTPTFAPDIDLIATRALVESKRKEWVLKLSNLSAVEAYSLLTKNELSISVSKPIFHIASILPGVRKNLALEVLKQAGYSSLDESADYALATVNNRLWPIELGEIQLDSIDKNISLHLFTTLSTRKILRYDEICWLLDYASTVKNESISEKAGVVFLDFMKNHGNNLAVDKIVTLLHKAEFFLLTVCNPEDLSAFILDSIRKFYASSLIITSLSSILQATDNSFEGELLLKSAIKTLAIYSDFSKGNTVSAIKNTYNFMNEMDEKSYITVWPFLIRLFLRGSKQDLKTLEDSIFEMILKFRENSILSERNEDVLLCNVAYASLKRVCGYSQESSEIFEGMSIPDFAETPWITYQYYKNQAQLAASNERNLDCISFQGKAYIAASFTENRILPYSSLLSYDVRLISSGHYTWQNVLERMNWLTIIFKYYGARTMKALVDCNLMIAHLSLLNRNTTLRHKESLIAESADLLLGPLSGCLNSLAAFSFLIGQPQKAMEDFVSLNGAGYTVPASLFKGVKHFLASDSTENIPGQVFCTAAETLNMITGKISLAEWGSRLGNIDQPDSSSVISLFRSGNLLQGYVSLLIGLAGGYISSSFLEEYKWLLKAIDARFIRSGFLKLPTSKSALGRMQNFMEEAGTTLIVDSEESLEQLYGNKITNSNQMCKKLTSEFAVEKVWIIRKTRNALTIISSSEKKMASILPVTVTSALDWISDSKDEFIDIPSEGWLRGYPKPGVFIVEVTSLPALNKSERLFIAAESLIPGKVLNKPKRDKLILVSGLLVQVALSEQKVSNELQVN